jgi:hypothetical protein
MRKMALLFVLLVTGCGGSSSFVPPSVSVWTGTYTGQLDFSGCVNDKPCGGDTITLTIAQPPDATVPGEFSSAITFGGNDSTTSKSLTGTGTTNYNSGSTNGGMIQANASGSIGIPIYLMGSGSARVGAPAIIQTIQVWSVLIVNKQAVAGPIFYGTLTRQ